MVPFITFATLSHAAVFRHSAVAKYRYCVHCSDNILECSLFHNGEDGQLSLLQTLAQVISHFALIKELLLWQHSFARHVANANENKTQSYVTLHLNIDEVQCDPFLSVWTIAATCSFTHELTLVYRLS